MSQAIATWTTTQDEEDLMNDDHAPLWRQMIDLAVAAGYKGETVLDYGCNQGGFLEMLYQKAPYQKAVGVDIAIESVAIAKQRLNGKPVTLGHPDDLTDMQDAFDSAFSHEVLYLLPDLQAHAQLIKQILKPGGYYYAAIGCHTDQPLWSTWKDLIGSYSNIPVHDYSLDDYAAAFFDAGFKVSVQPYRLSGFFPLEQANSYMPKVTDSIRYYNNDKVLFRFEKEA